MAGRRTRRPGVDTRRNTIYLINWYGRSDFKFHVYTKTDEPDPDTGYDFGELRESRKLIAWGGTTADDEENGLGSTRRVWFHDLSAGPEAWAGNWNVDDADLDGDGVRRLPDPGGVGVRRLAATGLAALTGDLAHAHPVRRARPADDHVAALPGRAAHRRSRRTSINLDSNTYEGWPGVDASRAYIKPRLLRRRAA